MMATAADVFVPIIEVQVDSVRGADRAMLFSALSDLAASDAQFQFAVHDEADRVLIAGIDESQLDQKIETLRRVLGFSLQFGPPQIAFRETITRRAEVDYTYKQLSGSIGTFAHVKLVLDPPGFDSDESCEIRIETSNLLDKHVAGVRAGLLSGLYQGPLQGFPVIGVTVCLVDGAYHDVDSSTAAFATAAMGAVREGLMKAAPVLLEPIMKVVVVAPEDCAGPIIDDLKLRRGRVKERDIEAQGVIVTALVPAINMFGYTNSLHALSKGRASHKVRFDHRAQVPPPDDPWFRPAVGMRA